MQSYRNICKWVVAVWLMLMGGFASPVWAYPQAKQPVEWQTRPVLSNERYPEYRFQSTSTLRPIVGQTSYMASESYNPFQASSPKRVRKSSPWDDDPDDEDENNHPLGEVDNPLPIGEPFVLLLLALVYALTRFSLSTRWASCWSRGQRCGRKQ